MLVRFPGISGSTATIIATGEIDPYRPSYFCSDVPCQARTRSSAFSPTICVGSYRGYDRAKVGAKP